VATKSISIVKHRAALARARVRSSAPAKALLETGALMAIGAALGYAEAKDVLPPGFLKNRAGEYMVPTKAALGLLAGAVAAYSSGGVREGALLVRNTCSATYGYAAGRAQALVAG